MIGEHPTVKGELTNSEIEKKIERESDMIQNLLSSDIPTADKRTLVKFTNRRIDLLIEKIK